MKTVDFSETIAACDLKVGRCRQLVDSMKICEYSRSMSFLNLDPASHFGMLYVNKFACEN